MTTRFNKAKFAQELSMNRITVKGFSLREAAEEIGISYATLNRMELKTSKIPDVETFYKCCLWLKMDMADFFEQL